jgi:23S rRNA (guanosine2251-2'-O)-methyltransferase
MEDNILYGKNSVKERLRANPKSIKEIQLEENFPDKEILKLILNNSIKFSYKNDFGLKRTKKAERLQGIIAKVEPFAFSSLKEIIASRENIIFLDGLNDPQNIGLIMRTVACFGGLAICIPDAGSADINDTVLHVASGGENYVKVAKVSNLAEGIKEAKAQGYCVVGTTVDGGRPLREGLLKMPVALVLGSEGQGISKELEEHLDFSASIPMKGANLSFNVASACAIFCHEIAKSY